MHQDRRMSSSCYMLPYELSRIFNGDGRKILMNNKKKLLPCQYCMAHNGYGKEINTSGDVFKLYHETGKKWRLISLSRSIFILKVKYCPMCGRKLKRGEE